MTGPKCVVHGCTNRQGQGGFTGDICSPCYATIVTGVIKPSGAWWYAHQKSRLELLQKVLDLHLELKRFLREMTEPGANQP